MKLGMAPTRHLLLCIHHHLPVGSHEASFEEAYWRAYEPLLLALERHAGVRVALHFSGCLLDYLMTSHPDFIERLRAAGERNQVEFLSGAYYEPILCLIPDHDKIGQIEKMTDLVERYLGRRPVGLWLAEHAWEPHLPVPIAKAGIRYAVLDENHFRLAGLGSDECLGYYRTEELGSALALFPILERLHEAVPFGEPEATVGALRGLGSGGERPALALMAVDGEKLGFRPGTHRRCHEEGWLDRFFEALEAFADEMPMIHLREALESHAPLGRVYLPATIADWDFRFADCRKDASDRSDPKDKRPQSPIPNCQSSIVNSPSAIRNPPAFNRNYLACHAEANQIHKKMLHVSRRIQSALDLLPRDQALHSAREFLWRGQCGDVYWPGLSGGVLAPHLRHAAYRNLIIAGRLLGESVHGEEPWLTVERLDYDVDAHDELLVETERWEVVCAPALGGELQEVNYKPCDLNLADTIADCGLRIADSNPTPSTQHPAPSTASLQSAIPNPQSPIGESAIGNRHRRLWAIDRFFDAAATFQDYCARRGIEAGDFVEQPYQERPTLSGRTITISMKRIGTVRTARGPIPISVTKQLRLGAGEDRVTWTYIVKNLGNEPAHFLWGVEWNINLLAGDAPDRYPFVQGQAVRNRRLAADEAHEGVVCFGLVDTSLDLRITFNLSEPARLWRTGLRTAAGIEVPASAIQGDSQPEPADSKPATTWFQGTCLLPNWRLTLEAGGQRQVEITAACSHGTAPMKPEH